MTHVLVALAIIFAAQAETLQTPTTGTSDPVALQKTEQVSFALIGTKNVSSIHLEGTAARHFGTDESGTFSADASAQASSLTTNFSFGTLQENRSAGNGVPHCEAVLNGAKTEISQHNCWTIPSWYFPVLSFSDADMKATVSDDKLTFSRVVSAKNQKIAASIESLSATTLSLGTDGLPSKLSFFEHPEDSQEISFPVEITYGDYRDVSGVKVPFHIEKTLNGTVVLEFNVTAATVNAN